MLFPGLLPSIFCAEATSSSAAGPYGALVGFPAAVKLRWSSMFMQQIPLHDINPIPVSTLASPHGRALTCTRNTHLGLQILAC